MRLQGSISDYYLDEYLMNQCERQANTRIRARDMQNYYMEEYGVNAIRYDDYGFEIYEED